MQVMELIRNITRPFFVHILYSKKKNIFKIKVNDSIFKFQSKDSDYFLFFFSFYDT